MSELWIPEAVDLRASGPGGTSDYPESPPRAVAHTTECPSGGLRDDKNYWFYAMAGVLRSKGAEPQLLYDPMTDHLGQFMPLNATGRALLNDGARRSNRVGRVCIQIEFVGWASRPFTRTWEPGPNFQAMIRAIRSWRIPDFWPSGLPPAYPQEFDERSRDVWYGRAGWFGHSQVPGNDHRDPGAIDDNGEFFRAAKHRPAIWPGWPERYPGRDHVGGAEGHDDPVNLMVKAALIAHVGPTGFRGEIDQNWDDSAGEKLADFKRELEIDEDGLGRKTWRALGRMPTDAPDFPGDKAFQLGSRSPNSLVGQALLVLQGFAKPMGYTISREWTPDAARALRRFQLSDPRLSGDADGDWGPLTWKLAWTDSE